MLKAARLIAYEYDSDKSQLYLDNHVRHFGHLSGEAIRLFELGINKGGSLLMWRDFFQSGKIVGIDKKRVAIEDPTGRIHTYQGDQRDTMLLDRIGAECAPDGFDIIIDDASHIAALTKISFWHLFERHMKPGGCYVIEDWRVGYWDKWVDGATYEFRARSAMPKRLLRSGKSSAVFASHSYGMVGLIKQLMDELGTDAITNPARNGRQPQRYSRFQRMEVCPGQLFIFRTTDHDAELVALQVRGEPKRQSPTVADRISTNRRRSWPIRALRKGMKVLLQPQKAKSED